MRFNRPYHFTFLAGAALAFAGLCLALLPGRAHALDITNIATVAYELGGLPESKDTNIVVIPILPPPTPSTVIFYQYAPGAPGNTPTSVDGGLCETSPGVFAPLPLPVDFLGNPIDPVLAPILETGVYHAGEPIFLTLEDLNRNIDPLVREFIEVRLTTSTGDEELLLFQETDINTGLFAAVIQSVPIPPVVTQFDCVLSVSPASTLYADYTDTDFPTDTAQADVLVDPFGIVFDSISGAPVDDVSVTLINSITGLPASVFGDDGISTYSATVVSGGSVVDSGGQVYNFPTGGYRFPYVAPGTYILEVVPPSGYTAPSAFPLATLQTVLDPGGIPYTVTIGSLGDVFVVLPGPALEIDIPVDPIQNQLLLQKYVSQTEASAGDFLQYRLTLENLNAIVDATAIVISDTLPLGMKYQSGSLQRDGLPVADPVISSDGQTLTIDIGTIPAGGRVEITYVVQVGAGIPIGQALNQARASGAGGSSSNAAQVGVTIRPPFFTDRLTIIGRVLEGDCAEPWEKLRGVPHVRILMEDGTYVLTDADGQYHFEGIRPGTHVVQVDLDSLPPGYEPNPCIQNTRFSGRSFSQFVDAQGGSLWRADFHLKGTPAPPLNEGEVGIRLQSSLELLNEGGAPPVPRQFTFRARFDTLGAQMAPESLTLLDELADQFRQMEIERIEVIGHTDNIRIKVEHQDTYADNYALSQARAQSVVKHLSSVLDLAPDRITAMGRGADQPVAENTTAAGRARNRRVEMIVYGKEGPDTGLTTVGGRFEYQLDLDGGSVPIANLRATVLLPDGVRYVPGSSRLDGEPLADPETSSNALTYRLGDVGADWQRKLEFSGKVGRNPGENQHGEPQSFTFRGNFKTIEATLSPEGRIELEELAETLSRSRIERIEVVGHTDNVRIAPRSRHRYADNYALSRARAQTLVSYLSEALGLSSFQITADGVGPDVPLAENTSVRGRAANRRVELRVTTLPDLDEGPEALVCPPEGYTVKALVIFETEMEKNARSPIVESRVLCALETPPTSEVGAKEDEEDLEIQSLIPEIESTPESILIGPDSGRLSTTVSGSSLPSALNDADAASEDTPESAPKNTRETLREKRKALLDDPEAAGGGDTDWLSGQEAGVEWLFPELDHNPRSPTIRIVIKHDPKQTITLSSDGKAVDQLSFDGVELNAAKTVAISQWSGLPLSDGDTGFEAEIHGSDGAVISTLSRDVHYANHPVQVELVPSESLMVADGIQTPVITVRILDRFGRPVRAGITGSFRINGPYIPARTAEQQQKRQLAGLDRFDPLYSVEGDAGLAYIELLPTTETGLVELTFLFQDHQRERTQDIRVWLEPNPRDWVLVGFAEGTLGYQTLSGNMQALEAQGVDEHFVTEGGTSLYAKGRVTGKWLLTLAYDSDKPEESFGRKGLYSDIDPNEFYTLYGDGTAQSYDAASQEKLYLKLERGKFYALFGDYNTGLTQTELSRYNRSLTGFKTEYQGGLFEVTAYGAETDLNFARDEMQGNGTSGLYRLSNGNIVLNSEKIQIETRGRFKSEQIISTQVLIRHLDYDIDYSAGTIFFRQPVASRDFSLNPIFIVVEYETAQVVDTELNAGGRVGMNLLDGKLILGASYIRDENFFDQTNLGGVDLTYKMAPETELRLEGARSEGDAFIAELEHHGERYDALLYSRRQEPGFGIGQQNASEGGTAKNGVEGRVRLTDSFSLHGDYYRQDNLVTDATRDAATTHLQYQTAYGGFRGGALISKDEAANGQEFESRQVLLGANRRFLDKKLDLSAQADISLGGKDDSLDFPSRYMTAANYALSDSVQLLVSEEWTKGASYDSTTTRAGLQVLPWKGARLSSTVNQSRMSENGSRTFGVMGLNQALLVGERWGFDIAADGSKTFNHSNSGSLVVNPNHPIASGGVISDGSLTDDFFAISTGATYRADLWSLNARAETRNGETTDRYGLRAGFLRQAQAGIAFAASVQGYRVAQSGGTTGKNAAADLSWAYRPLGSRWSILDKLEFKYDQLENGRGIPGGAVIGNNTLNVVGDARSRRFINNFVLNRVSTAWTPKDRKGNLLHLNQRFQLSFFYGAKYVLETFNGVDYSGFTDMARLEWRFDLTRFVDIGFQGGILHVWNADNFDFSTGPMIGTSPLENVWITLGYNITGFRDRDFSDAGYTTQGFYLKFRFKFDQDTKLELRRPYSENQESITPPEGLNDTELKP